MSPTSRKLDVTDSLNFYQYNRSKISHCALNFYFFNVREADFFFFSYVWWIFVFLYWLIISSYFFCLFFFGVVYLSSLTYRNSLYIMDINSLLRVLQMFLPPLAILFIYLFIYLAILFLLFTIRKFKIFMWSTLFFFLLMNARFWVFFFCRSF